MVDSSQTGNHPQVVILGGGFAGLNAAKGLKDAPVAVTLLDRHNYHLFQPLLYQVATAVLSPADIASPIRHILRDQHNARIGIAEVEGIDLLSRRILLTKGEVNFDFLIIALGATHSYFGHPEWETHARGLKTIEDALDIRRKVLLAYEQAEWEEDESLRRAKLIFVVIGGGPTGVEMAGALKEIASQAIPRDFRFIDTTTARVILIEGGSRLLPGMSEMAGQNAKRQLEEMGVEVRLGQMVTDIRPGEIFLENERLAAGNVVWAAGVGGSPVVRSLGVPLDRSGRVLVEPDLSVPGHPNVFVIGDLAHVVDPETANLVPGVAPAAIQMGQYVARRIAQRAAQDFPAAPPEPFRYQDKGTMATIGRHRAVASIKGKDFSGFFAWVLWCLVHIWTLMGFRKRVFVLFSWLWSYFSFTKNARLITGKMEECPVPDLKKSSKADHGSDEAR
jgi:NADH:ubiquinone reductase (H+-translocating)